MMRKIGMRIDLPRMTIRNSLEHFPGCRNTLLARVETRTQRHKRHAGIRISDERAIGSVGTGKMYMIRRDCMSAETASACDHDLKLINCMKMRFNEASRITLREKCHR